MNNQNYKQETERLAELCNGEDSPEKTAAYSKYCKLLFRAATEGLVGTPDRIRQLYPLVLDINDEIDEINRADKEHQRICEAADRLAEQSSQFTRQSPA